MASIHSGKIAVVSSSCLIACLGVLFSCVKDTPFVANNPLDEQGANWHPPVINAGTRDTSVSILDTVTFRAHGTNTAESEGRHHPLFLERQCIGPVNGRGQHLRIPRKPRDRHDVRALP